MECAAWGQTMLALSAERSWDGEFWSHWVRGAECGRHWCRVLSAGGIERGVEWVAGFGANNVVRAQCGAALRRGILGASVAGL